jgi:alkanesulfonate monooxygenase SsuD/methylene tetrahydromethanopterin reductase-like flavin-dependent oxidoreductase (luciferase family)
VCGVGAGDRRNEGEDRSVGLPPKPPAERRQAVLDLIGALRLGASGVPVWVGGLGPSMRAIAGEHADGWNAWGATPAEVSAAARVVLAAAATAGRPQPRVTWGGQVLLGLSAADAREQLATWSLGRPERDLAALVQGDPAAVAERLAALVEAGVQTFLLSFVGPGAARARRSFAHDVLPLVRRTSAPI